MLLANSLFASVRGLRIDEVAVAAHGLTVVVAVTRASARCPVCDRRARRLHSRFRRTLADLPCAGLSVTVRVHGRRFFCLTPSCPRRTFRERLPELAAPYARRRERLAAALQQIGLALSAESGARLAGRLGMPTSASTLLRLLRTLACPGVGELRAVGIDDWAWKRGQRSGTVVVDLDAHRLVDVLPDRDADHVASWLAAHPSIQVIARDRAGLYADAATRGAPQASQVADRWHVVDNLADALERFLLQKRAALKAATRTVEDAAATPPAEPAPEEMYPGKRRQPISQAGMERAEEERARRLTTRRAADEAVIAQHANGADIADVARTVGVSRTTIYRYLRQGPPERKQPGRPPGRRVLAPWEPYLLRRWAEGCHNASRLWREIREQGFVHSITNVQRFVVRLRQAGPVASIQGRSAFTNSRGPSARRVASLMLQRAEQRTAVQQAYLERLCQGDPAIATATRLTWRFLTLLRQRQGSQLEAWLVEAQQREVGDLRRFACGLQDDRAAVQAGLTLNYSNGQTEGQITRLKLIRRSMYGRGNFELLRQRLLGAA